MQTLFAIAVSESKEYYSCYILQLLKYSFLVKNYLAKSKLICNNFHLIYAL